MKLALKEITKIALLAAATAGTLSCIEVAKASPAKAEGNDISYSIVVHGASKHFGYDKTGTLPFNEANYGLGFEAERNNVVFRAGTYKDSYYKQAKYATIGYRYALLGQQDSFHAGASVNAGWLDGSGFKNDMAVVPQLEIGYKKTTLEIVYVPKFSKEQAQAVAVSLKYSF